MNTAAQIFVGLAGAFHVVIFVMESVLFRKPEIWKRFRVASAADAEVVRNWAYNQGFYNLFLGLGALGGLLWFGEKGETIALFACACMAGAGIVLVATDRRMLQAAAMQAGPPLLALILAAAL